MLSEKIEVNDFVNVSDSFTGLELVCDIKAVIRVGLNITDEKTYQAVVKNDTPAAVLKQFIPMAFKSAYGRVFPMGVEYGSTLEAIQPVADAVKEMLSGVIATNGMEITEAAIDAFELSAADKMKFEDFRAKKGQLG